MTESPRYEDGLDEVAVGKLTRVLGTVAGQRVFEETLNSLHLATLATPDDLFAFGVALTRRKGFESAVGGLITVAAVLRGAAGQVRP